MKKSFAIIIQICSKSNFTKTAKGKNATSDKKSFKPSVYIVLFDSVADTQSIRYYFIPWGDSEGVNDEHSLYSPLTDPSPRRLHTCRNDSTPRGFVTWTRFEYFQILVTPGKYVRWNVTEFFQVGDNSRPNGYAFLMGSLIDSFQFEYFIHHKYLRVIVQVKSRIRSIRRSSVYLIWEERGLMSRVVIMHSMERVRLNKWTFTSMRLLRWLFGTSVLPDKSVFARYSKAGYRTMVAEDWARVGNSFLCMMWKNLIAGSVQLP